MLLEDLEKYQGKKKHKMKNLQEMKGKMSYRIVYIKYNNTLQGKGLSLCCSVIGL